MPAFSDKLNVSDIFSVMLLINKKFLSFLKFKILLFKSFLKIKVREFLLDSYSQYGEDIILGHLLLQSKFPGFYIDIGAHAPKYLNNTYRFYRRGWQGINIEPNLFSAKDFARSRPRDLTLSGVAIGSEDSNSIFYRFYPSTLSTLDKDEASKYQCQGFKLLSMDNVKTLTLKSLFEKYAPKKQIDFISIDIEGYELEALKSNDWNIYRPWLLLIETNRNGEEIAKYLKSSDYVAIWTNKTNTIYVDGLSNRVNEQSLADAL